VLKFKRKFRRQSVKV